ncbi:MAG: STAS domain-containing protein [Clostridia bacterium]|nr:STAS domain-containing protein [Clostridia bacterium]
MELEIKMEKEGTKLTVFLNGELTTMTAPELKKTLEAEVPETDTLLLDFAECDLVSSAGLRVLLGAFKSLKAKKGQMKLLNIGENFSEVLYITGLDAVFDCE